VGIPEGKKHLEDLDEDVSIIRKWILINTMGCRGFIWLRIGTSGGLL